MLSKLPTAPSGKGFAGYYSAATGGTQYIYQAGVGIKELSGAITLYAQYSEAAAVDIGGTVLY